MFDLLSDAAEIALEEGPKRLATRGSEYVKTHSRSLRSAMKFAAADARSDYPRDDTVMTTLRSSTFDSDTLSLVLLASECPWVKTVYLAVSSREHFYHYHEPILSCFRDLDVSIKVVETHTRVFVSAFLRSRIVFLRGRPDLLHYRFLNRNPERKFVILYHGIITKASGNLRQDSLKRQERMRRSSIEYQPPGKYLSRLSTLTHARPVGSDIEVFYRATADGIKPSFLKKCGYPKYDRLQQLIRGEDDPILSEEAAEALASDRVAHRILYAPTHKGGDAVTSLFPFSDFDVEQLRKTLEALDAELYVRVHISEEEAGLYDDVVDGETIRYAGHEFSPSSVEILPYFDVLVTDYSSIYTEYLPLDRPVVFVEDTENPYWKNKGIAYDYEKYFPGPKVGSFEAFEDELEASLEDASRYRDERQFVSRALVPDADNDFFECVSAAVGITESPPQ